MLNRKNCFFFTYLHISIFRLSDPFAPALGQRGLSMLSLSETPSIELLHCLQVL